MAFKGIDFEKLASQTPEDRAAQEAERQARLVSEDEKRRNELSKRTVTVKLEHDPETRSTRTGAQMVHFRGQDEKGKTVAGVYFTPDHLSDEERRAKIDGLREGNVLKLDGYWKKREWKDASNKLQSSWEFQIQRFEAKEGGQTAERGVLAQAADLRSRGYQSGRITEIARGPSDLAALQASRHYSRARDGR